MSDVNCPYCDAEVEINHDDGYGYEEDRTFEQECSHCEKCFSFTTSIWFLYQANKADCLNGSEHKYEESITFPKKYTRLFCKDCGDVTDISEERRAELAEEDAA